MKVKLELDLKSDFPKARKVVLVTDSNVDHLYGDAVVRQIEATGLQVERIVFPAGEKSKTLEMYAELVRGFAALGMTRSDLAIALGGGVVGDLTGFAAATYMRGIGFVQVPTTLLSMVDSSIGGKTGVDIPEGKNLVGAFHLPRRIVRNVAFLETLPEKEMKNGLAEMIKTAVLFDVELFEELESFGSLKSYESLEVLAPLVERCAKWKQRIVDDDFKESGKRKFLNLGHTFGHAIEAASDFRLSHGECVAMGMRIVGRDVPEIDRILDLYGFPTYDPRSNCVTTAPSPLDPDGEGPLRLNREQVISYLANDKKRSGEMITLVIPRKVGECELVETPMAELESWLRPTMPRE